MKLDTLKKFIKEAVREAVREEVGLILLEQKQVQLKESIGNTLTFTSNDVIPVKNTTKLKSQMDNMFSNAVPPSTNLTLQNNPNSNPFQAFLDDSAKNMDRKDFNNLVQIGNLE